MLDGIIIGFAIASALGVWSHLAYQWTLEHISRDRSCECIRGKFYYIVPEAEYNQLRCITQSHHPAIMTHDQVNDSLDAALRCTAKARRRA